GRENAFQTRQLVKRCQRLGVRRSLVLDPAAVTQVGMLGADARIVEAGGNRMGSLHLSIFILEHVAEAAMKHARMTRGERGSVLAGSQPFSRSFDPDQLHCHVVEKREE